MVLNIFAITATISTLCAKVVLLIGKTLQNPLIVLIISRFCHFFLNFKFQGSRIIFQIEA
jgi:hypothetical protein